METKKKVTSRTRASWNGTMIQCPYCNLVHRVGHFSWYALVCEGCDNEVKKLDYWLVGHCK